VLNIKWLLIILINIIGFFMMGYDKMQAKKKGWRVKEKTLLFLAISGGVLGCLLGMYIFKHKTRNILFRIGLPIILIIYTFYLRFII